MHEWHDWFVQAATLALPRVSIPSARLAGLALALTGVRRCGKTYMAVLFSREIDKIQTQGRKAAVHQEPERIFYFNFEDPVVLDASSPELIDELLELHAEEFNGAPSDVVLDEIQQVPHWERWVRKAVELNRYRLTVTGSSSKLLSSELATAIAGRVIEQPVWPLSFAEYLLFLGKTEATVAQRQLLLKRYLKWGGFPRVVLQEGEVERVGLLKQYLQDIVLRDVAHRHEIRDARALDRLVAWYLTNVSCLHSYQAIRKAFGGSIEAIAAHTAHLTEAFLVFEVQRYHPNLKVQARDPKKVYLIDNGLRTVSLASDREDWGRLAENTVYVELRRRGCEVFYFKGQQETDFLVTELGQPRAAIQVAFDDLSDPKTRTREVSALRECLVATGLEKGLVLTEGLDDRYREGRLQIDFVPLHRWLCVH